MQCHHVRKYRNLLEMFLKLPVKNKTRQKVRRYDHVLAKCTLQMTGESIIIYWSLLEQMKNLTSCKSKDIYKNLKNKVSTLTSLVSEGKLGFFRFANRKRSL